MNVKDYGWWVKISIIEKYGDGNRDCHAQIPFKDFIEKVPQIIKSNFIRHCHYSIYFSLFSHSRELSKLQCHSKGNIVFFDRYPFTVEHITTGPIDNGREVDDFNVDVLCISVAEYFIKVSSSILECTERKKGLSEALKKIVEYRMPYN